VHEPRPLAVAVAQDFQHAVEMARRARAALHRKPYRLVEHQHVDVLVERDRLQERAGLFVRLVAARARLRLVETQRRNPHGLTGFETVLRLGALAVDPHLAFADDALDVGEAQARKARLEEAVDAHAGFVGRNGDILHGRRHRRRRSPFPVILR